MPITRAFYYRWAALAGLIYCEMVTTGQAQTPIQPSRHYRTAYCLLRRSAEFREFTGRRPRVAVYDSLIRADRSAFAAELLLPRPLSAGRLDSLAQADQTQPPTRFDAAVARLTKTCPLSQGTFIVAFAPAGADSPFAEISYNQHGPGRFSRTPTFGQTLLYLIYFDARRRPGPVYTHVAAYN